MGFFEAMSVITAAAVIVLAFAGAGLLRQLREVQHELALLQRSNNSDLGRPAVPPVLHPRDGAEVTAALLVSPGCEVCVEILPIFVESGAWLRPRVDPVLLSWDDAGVPRVGESVRTVLDTTAYRSVDPGWAPAMAFIDGAGEVVGIEPVGSPTAIRETLAKVANSATRSAP